MDRLCGMVTLYITIGSEPDFRAITGEVWIGKVMEFPVLIRRLGLRVDIHPIAIIIKSLHSQFVYFNFITVLLSMRRIDVICIMYMYCTGVTHIQLLNS
jgi:hypothetical protein